ncbi:glycosyl hydrolase family 8 [Herbiconiux sp. KACC 21604]|uniref:glycosyl hydrolase family 8 n=1 Tax=unclassified Herbiconiux TaxID=2618217 RepID=UPI0014911BEF|nr:glycosyl hydrolase family 8 [Herbiconiux sp. SALV-R1]QJU52493.1 hypothetical protein HL652_01725 [Herbiconiux sp. SALV-R1]WPO87367.1 glycosyl hydrolase family 8 [Herbiconiux sp. KACC 21604]
MRRLLRAGAATIAAALLGVLFVAAPAAASIAEPTETDALAAAATRPFGSHPVASPAGSATAPGGAAAADRATAAAYDAWKADYLVAGCGTGRYYVDAASSMPPGSGRVVVSEGQGYGMVITASMAGHDPDARAIFDGLYRYVLDHPSSSQAPGTGPKPMAWNQSADCSSPAGNDSSATDGDLDIAFGLLLADTQWGSAGGIDYAGAARALLARIKATEFDPDTRLPKLGDWVGDGAYRFGVRSSDLMPDHFVAFENATGDPFWGQAARAAGELIATTQAEHAPDTGLLPDFVVDTDTDPQPAPGNYLESPDDGSYGWNATRVPWRLAAAAQLVGDAPSWASADRIADWVIAATDGDPAAVRAGYELGGKALADYSDIAFTAPLGAAGLPDRAKQAWVSAAWNSVRAAPAGGYYSDSLRLQVMLLASGNSWLPTTSPAPAVTRIGGSDRYAVSAAVSATTFAPGASTVYVASGEVFPDALSASAAAGAEGSPVLLVRKTQIPDAVAAELRRLAPRKIVFLGGPNTIGTEVEAALKAIAPTTRIGGADRYAVSAAVSATTFAPGARAAYVPSGEVFPDALAGSAAAGGLGAPVLLTRKAEVPSAIADELGRLDPAALRVLGGQNTVSTATQNALARIAPTTRVGGADRYAAAAAISAEVFAPGRTRTVYVASGEVFPDALSASATAIANHAPVLLVTRDAVPAATAAEISRLSPARIVVLGGVNTVSPAVESALNDLLR